MPHLDSNITSNIYYAYIGSKMLWLARTTLDKNTFLTLTNRLLKRMHKRGNKHRSIISMLNKMFANILLFTAFSLLNLFHCLELELHIYMFACCVVCFCFLFCSFCSFFFFIFFICLLVCICGYNVIIALYLHLYMFLWVGNLYYNFTIISI